MSIPNRQIMADQGEHDAKNGIPAFAWFGTAGTLWTRRANSDEPRLVDAANNAELLEACAYALAYETTRALETR